MSNVLHLTVWNFFIVTKTNLHWTFTAFLFLTFFLFAIIKTENTLYGKAKNNLDRVFGIFVF